MIEIVLLITITVAIVLSPPQDEQKKQEQSCRSNLIRKAIRTGERPDLKICRSNPNRSM